MNQVSFRGWGRGGPTSTVVCLQRPINVGCTSRRSALPHVGVVGAKPSHYRQCPLQEKKTSPEGIQSREDLAEGMHNQGCRRLRWGTHFCRRVHGWIHQAIVEDVKVVLEVCNEHFWCLWATTWGHLFMHNSGASTRICWCVKNQAQTHPKMLNPDRHPCLVSTNAVWVRGVMLLRLSETVPCGPGLHCLHWDVLPCPPVMASDVWAARPPLRPGHNSRLLVW